MRALAKGGEGRHTCSVSAVSPDWLTKTHMSSRKMGALRSSRSDASSSDTCVGEQGHRLEVHVHGQRPLESPSHFGKTCGEPRLTCVAGTQTLQGSSAVPKEEHRVGPHGRKP